MDNKHNSLNLAAKICSDSIVVSVAPINLAVLQIMQVFRI